MANLTIKEIQNLLRQAGWKENMIAKWSAIVIYESNGNPNATNKVGEYSIGLLQMNMNAHGTKYGTETQLKDALFNLKQAWKLWNIQGDNAWFNSVKKYKNNYQGVATKALSIYNGNSTDIIPIVNSNTTSQVIKNNQNTTGQNLPVIDNLQKETGFTKDEIILIGGAILILTLI
jgi:hypothetical protein